VIYFFSRKGIQKAIPAVRAWLRAKKEESMAWKISRTQQVGALALGLLIFVPPMPSRVSTPMVLEAGKTSHVRAVVAGKVEKVYVRQGDAVKAGQLLATLENPEIKADERVVSEQYALATSALRNGQERSDPNSTASATGKIARMQEELDVMRLQVAGLELRAPFDGTIEAPGVEQKAGEYLAAGDEFAKVVDRNTMRARILVRDLDLQDVRVGAPAKVKVLPFPFRTFNGHVERIKPAAASDAPVAQTEKLERMGQQLTNYIAVDMEFPNADGSLTEGMTGTAKVSGKSSPLGWQMGRSLWRWLRGEIW
jgi:RND family efflux transporter MFP subunit